MSLIADYFLNNRPAWVDLSSSDPEASRDFYTQALRLEHRGQPRPAVRRLRDGQLTPARGGGHRTEDGSERADGMDGVHRHG